MPSYSEIKMQLDLIYKILQTVFQLSNFYQKKGVLYILEFWDVSNAI